MKKVYYSLTQDQLSRGVVFSSTLSKSITEKSEDIIHEVLNTDPDIDDQISRLLDDAFFNGSDWKYNIIRK